MRRIRAPQTDTAFSAVTVPLEVDVRRTYEEQQEGGKAYIADPDVKSADYPRDGKYDANV